ncbi:MAG TPA: hypothetical protein VHX39_11480, partial [Acetobacteraceae bacterium]|nr:hypothetical protein [Acetobacteraceae bacterium]
MDNFLRAVRLALHYHWTVAASFVCAVIVALLWSANISLLYPLVEVVGMNETMQQRVDAKIAESSEAIVKHAAEQVRLKGQLARASAEDAARLQRQLTAAITGREAAEESLQRFRWAKPWVDDYLPNDPFHTLV